MNRTKNQVYLLALLLLLLLCCQQLPPGYHYTKKEAASFLDQITANALVCITDLTEADKKPTDELLIFTKYPLPKAEVDEYNQKGFLVNKDNAISDFASYEFGNYELINEKNESLKFVNNGRAVYLREAALWTHNNQLCQKLAIDLEVNKPYEQLKGYITIRFKMPGNVSKEAKIPVHISIYEKAPD